MRILGVKINNYKSFSDKNNILRFDSENTLGLIGKNESGKSNTLLALKDLLFFDSKLNLNIFNDYNRLINKPVSISLEFEFDKNDLDFTKYGVKSLKSVISFRKEDGSIYMDFNGCLSEIIKSDVQLKEYAEEVKKWVLKITAIKIVKFLKIKFLIMIQPL